MRKKKIEDPNLIKPKRKRRTRVQMEMSELDERFGSLVVKVYSSMMETELIRENTARTINNAVNRIVLPLSILMILALSMGVALLLR